ncbi:MAG TPA: hypothetical protein VGW38_07600, partial [Chloroflexota bacterium]|nr:hypothetical protein [Chloroflexota bacterium]
MWAPILLLLLRRWAWIGAGALIVAVLAGVLVVLQPRSYTASVEVIPKRARIEVDYETRIRMLSDGATRGPQAGTSLLSATAERRQTLAQLVRSADIEASVRKELGDSLPAALRTPGALLSAVQGRVVPRSELISIQVTAPSPTLAGQIATSWARAYEAQVNALYTNSNDSDAKIES